MFRKSIFAIAAIGTVAAAAIAPTSASAYYKGKNHWHGYGSGVSIYAHYNYGYRPHCWLKKRWIKTYYGPRLSWVQVCRRYY